jgi:hypothetical protein
MRSTFAAAAAALMAAVLAVSGAFAQQPGSEECLGLEAQLASLGRPKQADGRQFAQNVARQQAELDRAVAQSKSLGCAPRLFFMPAPPPECRPLGDRIKQLEAGVDRARAQAAQAQQQPTAGGDPRRRDLLIALARNNCGPQYRLVERRVAAPQQERKGFFEMLFGGGGSEQPQEETVIEPEMDPSETPRVSTFRTVCVRTCDGFFFPISFQTTRNAFERDEAICQATCPGAEAKLFAYPNPGGQMEQASSVEGEPYAKLENAFRYRKEFVAGCSCKPEGMNWAEALSGVEDKTVKKGDIVVDEQKAHEMSRPQRPGDSQAQVRSPQKPEAPAPESGPETTLDAPASAPAQLRRSVPKDVIILDEPQSERGVERRPLDGPNMEPAPGAR